LKKLQENYQQELRASFGNNSDRSDRRNSFYKLTNQGTTEGRSFAKFKIEELNEKKKMANKQSHYDNMRQHKYKSDLQAFNSSNYSKNFPNDFTMTSSHGRNKSVLPRNQNL
jgi:hypothetical protein|tara:strand:+ start:2770 stop:3105 length:336 start_codon:yes stop_codon:yes gene_type:complete